MPEQITSWDAALQGSLAQALALVLAALPKIMAFALILGLGWALAAVVAGAVGAILGRVRLNDLAHRSGLGGFVERAGVDIDAIGFVAIVSKWFIRLIALVAAFEALGLPAVSEVLRQLLLWLPNLVVALVALVIGGLAARALSGLVRASAATAELSRPDVLASAARYSVWAFAIVLAVNQIGIASNLINTLFAAVVAGLALAVGLAFGLGARDTAAVIVRELSLRIRGGSVRLGGPARSTRQRRTIGAGREY